MVFEVVDFGWVVIPASARGSQNSMKNEAEGLRGPRSPNETR